MTRDQFAREILLKEQRIKLWESYQQIPEEDYSLEELQ